MIRKLMQCSGLVNTVVFSYAKPPESKHGRFYISSLLLHRRSLRKICFDAVLLRIDWLFGIFYPQ